MADNITYPYLAYSELTGKVYIVLNENEKIDVTTQYEFIKDKRDTKHGKWIIVGGDVGYVDAQCSVCKNTKVFDDFGDGPHLDDFCPKCSAKMDGKEV